MNTYERKVLNELIQWRKKMLQRPPIFTRVTKKAQYKVNQMIPEQAHEMITESIKKLVKGTLVGSDFTTKGHEVSHLTLQEKDLLIKEKIKSYKRTAAVEGAGTGMGGILLGLADFPLLLSIKMKLLFEIATLYGYDVKKYEERLFLLYLFQLAFSSDKHRKETFMIIANWNEKKNELIELDWRKFQQEYRDHIDLIKMMQIVPGVGAVVGAFANFQLLNQLGETAMNGFRLRILNIN
ncbi:MULTISPECIES: EcsC family protein [Bacillaceae]|uniref:EcsC family protein n=1 Tax=Bacillaceae TaxID=186817 RepID=UPI001BDEC3FA|nr:MULTISPECIES: EcsC family protein [Bacillaceae]MDX8361253.1 EcsC family protein [Cytobacillus sp. IB215316]